MTAGRMARRDYLAWLGIESFALRGRATGSADGLVPTTVPTPLPATEGAHAGAGDGHAGAGDALAGAGDVHAGAEDALWRALEAEVSVCTRCELHRGRTRTVFGVGRRDADLLVIGEAPGADEDRQGEPFVGRAGQLLNAMLRAIGLARGDVYIANILKCRPPNNRDPSPGETGECTGYLERQIALLRPRAALAVGRIAAQHLLQSDEPVGRLRGRVRSFGAGSIPMVVTYHPAYLLRSPQAKAKAWADLCLLRRLLTKTP